MGLKKKIFFSYLTRLAVLGKNREMVHLKVLNMFVRRIQQILVYMEVILAYENALSLKSWRSGSGGNMGKSAELA